jgi:hypothetical protein
MVVTRQKDKDQVTLKLDISEYDVIKHILIGAYNKHMSERAKKLIKEIIQK